MIEEAMLRLLDYHRRRYWLTNGWSIRIRVVEAHGIPRCEAFDHRHQFRRPEHTVPYDFRSADELISDFFAAVERACSREGIAFEFDTDEVDLDLESDDDEEISD